jgi:hypothetical protein
LKLWIGEEYSGDVGVVEVMEHVVDEELAFLKGL